MTRSISFLFGLLADLKRPKLFTQLLIKVFIKKFNIDLTLAKKTNFHSLNEMFTREVKKDFNNYSDDSFVHPVQGELVSYGKVSEGQVYLIKGKHYSLKDLIGEDAKDLGESFFYNYYLSPQDYHRVHHPVSGVYQSCFKIKGALYPVAPWFIKIVPNVFIKNFRTVSKVKTGLYGTVYIVMVGALNVGSIEMSDAFFSEGVKVVKTGDHLGTFRLGSSVVVICEKEFDLSGTKKVFFEEIKDKA